MMFCINPGSIVSRLGAPLQGRVTFYRHDTDELATIYTLEGQDFVQAANPQLLDINGRLDDSVFFDCGIIDVRIEQYIGPDGFLSVDAPDEYFAAFDVFEYGIKLDDGGAIGHVETIADLRGVSPDAKFVWVNGYYAVGDAPSRLYYWDEASEDIEDGGYVVGSDVEGATGKWILLWGDEVLPCTVYGVKPGTEANLAAFLDYPALVGSMSLKTAPCQRFVAGTYSTGGNLATSRTLCFDTGATFANGPTFACKEVRTFGPVTGYIADFKFGSSSNGDAVAHSSWFKTLKAFWTCKANRLVIDDTNYFTGLNIDEGVTVANAVITGSKRIPATYTASAGYIRFDDCVFDASKIFNPQSDYIRFCGMREFPKSVWTSYSAAYFDFGTVPTNKVQYKSTGDLNTVTASAFGDADMYIKCAVANGATSLNLESMKAASGFESSTVTEIWYADIGGVVQLHTANIEIHNSAVALNVESGASLTIEDSSLSLDAASGKPLYLTAYGSNVAATIDPKVTTLTIEGGTFRGRVLMDDADIDAGTECNVTHFKSAHVIGEHSKPWKVTHVACDSCLIDDVVFEIYPYLDNSQEKVQMQFIGNHFKMDALIKVSNPPTRAAKNVNGAGIMITDNHFGQNDTLGISAPFYGNDASAFWADMTPRNASTHYRNNTGRCLNDPDMVHCNLLTSTYASGADTVNYGMMFGFFNISSAGRFNGGKDGILRPTVWGTTQGFGITGFADAQFVHAAMIDPSDNNIFKVYHSWSDDEGYDSSKTMVYIN